MEEEYKSEVNKESEGVTRGRDTVDMAYEQDKAKEESDTYEEISEETSLLKIQNMITKILDQFDIPENLENLDATQLDEEYLKNLEANINRILEIEDHLDKGLESPLLYARLGVALAYLGKYEKAIKMFEKATSLGYNQWESEANIAFCRYKMGDYDTAKMMFEEILEQDDSIGLAWYGMGLLSEIEGNYPAAISMYKIATRTSLKAIPPWLKLARAYEDIGRFQEAIRCYKTLVNKDKNFVDGWMGLTHGYYALNQLDMALKYAKKALEIDNNRADIWRLLGNIYEEKGDIDEAMLCYEKANELEPSAATHTDKGNVYLRMHKYDKAIEAYKKALEENPNDDEALRGIAVAYAMIGHYDDALINIKKALELAPTNYINHLTQGDVYILLGNYKEGESSIKKVLSEQPFNVEALNRLGRLNVALLKFREAASVFHNVIEVDKQNDEAILYLTIIGHMLKRKYIHTTEGGMENIIDAFETTVKKLEDSIAIYDILSSAGITLPLIERGIIEVRGRLYLSDFQGSRAEALKVHDDLTRHARREIERILNATKMRFESMAEKGVKLPFTMDELEKIERYFSEGKMAESAKALVDLVTTMKAVESNYERCVDLIYKAEGDIKSIETIGLNTDNLKNKLSEAKDMFENGRYEDALVAIDTLQDMILEVRRRHQRILEGINRIADAKDAFKVEGIPIDEIEDFESRIRGAIDAGEERRAFDILQEALRYIDKRLMELEKRRIEEDLRATQEIIIEIKGEGADVKEAESELEKAKELLAMDDYDGAKDCNKRALELALKAKDKLREKEVHEILKAIWEILKSLKRHGEDTTRFENSIDEIRTLLSKGEYLKAKERSIALRRETLNALKGYSMEMAKRVIKDTEEYLTKMVILGAKAEDIKNVEEHLRTAKTAMEYADYITAENSGKKALTIAKNSIKGLYEEKINAWEDRIRSLNEIILRYGKTVEDIESIVDTIKRMMAEGKYEEALETARTIRENMKKKAMEYFKQASDETIKEAEGLLTDFEMEHKVDLSSMKRMLNDARDAFKYGDYENALFIAKDVIEGIKLKEKELLIEKYGKVLEDIDNKISFLKNLNALKDDWINKRKQIESMINSGRFKVAEVEIKDLNHILEKGIKKSVSDYIRAFESEITPILYSMEKKGYSISEYEKSIDSVKMIVTSDPIKAYNIASELKSSIRKRYDEIMHKEIIAEIKDLKQEAEELKQHGQDIEIIINKLKEAENALNKHDFNSAKEAIRLARKVMFEKGTRFFKEKYRKDIEDCLVTLHQMKEFGVDIAIGERLIDEIEEHIKYDDFEVAKDYMKKLRKFIAEKLEEHQRTEAERLVNELETVIAGIKSMGGDVFEIEIMAKQALDSYENEEYVRSKSISISALKMARKRFEKSLIRKIKEELKIINKGINLVKAMGYPEEECINIKYKMDEAKDLMDRGDTRALEKLTEEIKSLWRKTRNNALILKSKEILVKIKTEYNEILQHKDLVSGQEDNIKVIDGLIKETEDTIENKDGVMAMYYTLAITNKLTYLSTVLTLNKLDTTLTDIKNKIDKLSEAKIDTTSLENRYKEVSAQIIGLVPDNPKTPIVLRSAIKKIKEIEEECDTLLTKSKIERAKESIAYAEDMIKELKSIGVDVSKAERILEEARGEYRRSEKLERAVDIISGAIKAIDLASKASDIALNLLKDYQIKRAKTAIERAKNMMEELSTLGVPVDTIEPLISESEKLFKDERYVDSSGLAEQAIEKGRVEKRKYMLEKSRRAIEECSEIVEKLAAKGVRLSHLNNILIDMKERFARDEFSEVLNLSLRFKKLAREEEEKIKRKHIRDKILEFRDYILKLKDLGANIGDIEAELDNISNIMDNASVEELHTLLGEIQDKVNTLAREFIPEFISRESERFEAWIEGDKLLDIDSSMFLKDVEELRDAVKMLQQNKIEPIDILSKYHDLKDQYIRHRYEAIRHHILNGINKLRMLGANTEAIERTVNEAEFIKIKDINEALNTIIRGLEILRTTTDTHYANLATQGLKDLHVFVSECSRYEKIDISPLKEKIEMLERALSDGDGEGAYKLLNEAKSLKDRYIVMLERLKLSEDLNEIEEKIKQIENELKDETYREYKAMIIAIRNLLASDKIAEAKENLRKFTEEFDVTYRTLINKKAKYILSEIEVFAKTKGDLLPTFKMVAEEIIQQAKDYVEKGDISNLLDLKVGIHEKYRRLREDYLTKKALKYIEDARLKLKAFIDVINEFSNYLEANKIEIKHREIENINEDVIRTEEIIKKEGGSIGYYHSLRTKSNIKHSITKIVDIIKDQVIADFKWTVDNMESLKVTGLNDMKDLIDAGLKRIEMEDYAIGLEMLKEAHSKIRAAIRNYYNKIVSYMMISIENTIREMASKGIDTSEIKAIYDKGKEAALAERWVEAENLMRTAERKARMVWNLFERSKLEPIVKELIEKYEELKRKGADIDAISNVIQDLKEAFEAERYEDVKTLLPTAEEKLDAARRRYENEVAKLRYMRKKAEENIHVVKKELIELKSMGYDVDEAESMLKDAEDAMAEGNFAKAVQDSIRARQMISQLTKEFEEKQAKNSIEKVNNLLNRCTELGIDLSKQRRMVEDATLLFKSGDYLGAKETAKRAYNEAIEEAVNKLKDRATTFLGRADELLEKYRKEGINCEKFETKLKVIKDRYDRIRDSMAIEPLAKLASDVRDLISEAYGNYIDAIIKKASQRQSELKAEVEKLIEKGIDVGTIYDDVKNALGLIEKDRYEEALILLDSIAIRIEELKKRYAEDNIGVDIDKKMAMDAYDALSECDKMFSRLVNMPEVPSDEKAHIELIIEEAKRAFEEEKWDVSYKRALEAKSRIMPYLKVEGKVFKRPEDQMEITAIPTEIEDLKKEIAKAKGMGFDTSSYEVLLEDWKEVIDSSGTLDKGVIENYRSKAKKAIEELKGMYSMVDSTKIFLVKKAQRSIKEAEDMLEKIKSQALGENEEKILKEHIQRLEEAKKLLQSGDPVGANQKALKVKMSLKKILSS